jgi:hypothetical protein
VDGYKPARVRSLSYYNSFPILSAFVEQDSATLGDAATGYVVNDLLVFDASDHHAIALHIEKGAITTSSNGRKETLTLPSATSASVKIVDVLPKGSIILAMRLRQLGWKRMGKVRFIPFLLRSIHFSSLIVRRSLLPRHRELL